MKRSEVLRRAYEPIFKRKEILVANLLNAFSAGILPILSIYVLSFTSQSIVTGDMELEEIIRVLFIYSVLSLSLKVIESLSYARTYTKFTIERSMIFSDIIEKIIEMDFKYYEDPGMMDRVSTVFQGVASNDSGLEGVYHKIFDLGKDIFTGIILVFIVSRGSFLIIPVIGLALYFDYKINNYLNEYIFSKRDEISNISRKTGFYARTASDFSYGKDMRLYPMMTRFEEYFYRELGKLDDILNDIFKKKRNCSIPQVMSIILAEFLSIIILINKLGTSINIPEFIKYLTSIGLLMTLLKSVFFDLASINENLMYVRNTFEFLDEDLIDKDGRDIDFKGQPIELRFEDVEFSYPGSNKKVFDGISFTIKEGESLALVGLNGAGKTSLVKLITGLYSPDKGKIYYNGIDGSEISQRSKFKLFSVVFQDVNPMAFTIAENIGAAREDIDRERVIDKLEQIGLMDKIELLDKGIDSMLYKIVDEDGVILSGGENQKLIIARALYKKGSSMLIMDEPTSSLDALAEEKVYRELEAMMKGRTSLFISHRLASTKFCDRIMLMDKGEIKEIGNHEELTKKDGIYRKMYETQGKYYREED